MYGAVHDTTVPVELKNAQYAGLLDPGRYKVSVKMSDKAKECITSMRIFGNEEDLTEDCYTDDGCTRVLYPVTEPKIEFQFSSDPECMRDMSVYITIVPVTTDEAELDDKMAFQIGLRPLTVSFEDLVRVVANPHFGGISDRALLSSEVGYLLAKAALGKISDWKKEIPPHTNEPVVDAGDAKVQISFNGSDHCYYSPDKEHWEWRLCLSKGWPVFVKDAEDWKDLQEGSCALPDESDKSIYNIINETYGSGAYNNYLLTVKFGGSECEGLSGYGTAYIEHWQNIMNPLKNPIGMITYAATCGATTSICYAATTAGTGGIAGALSPGKVVNDIILCGLAPAITGWLASQQIEESKTQAQASYILAQTLGAGELMTAKYAVLPTVQISRLRSAIRGGADLVKAVSKDTAKFDDFVKLGVRYTETADQFEKIANQFPRFAGVRSAGTFITDDADDILRLLAAYGKNPSAEKLVEIGSRLKIGDATELTELAKTEAGRKQLVKEIVNMLKEQKIGDAANKTFKGMDEELRNIVKKEFKASFICGAAGAVAGTLSYYALIAETGTITTPSLTVEIDNLFDAMSIAVSNNRIGVGA